METIIAALISAASALAVCMITNNKQSVKLEASLDKQTALINQKIEILSERVEKHNSVIERTYNLEKLAALHDEQIKVANHRISDIEKHEESRRSDGK